MKYLRFLFEGRLVTGEVVEDRVYVCDGSIAEGYVRSGASCLLSEIRLEIPVVPTKVLCVGLNYVDHIKEFGHPVPESPVIFMKPGSSLLEPGGTIRCPKVSRQVDYESELAIVIGKTAKNVRVEDAASYIFGYTCANDVTARDRQDPNGQWILAKGCDTFCPIGPWIVTDLDVTDLEVKATLNGKIVQKTRTSFLLFKPEYLVSYLSEWMTLYPGDVILTGTSSGVGPMLPGDNIVVEIEGIGRLENRVGEADVP